MELSEGDIDQIEALDIKQPQTATRYGFGSMTRWAE